MTSSLALKPNKEASLSIQQKVCKVDGCNSLGRFRYGGYSLSKGLCNKHYIRLRKNGSPEKVKYRMDGRTKHPLYSTYSAMKARCYIKSHKHYDSYGGRGIFVCDRWLGIDGFTNFIEDMGVRPPGHTLDRVNNSLGYCPENCKWSTHSEQENNKRTNRHIYFDGRDYTIAELIRKYGDTKEDSVYRNRINYGWPVEKVFNTPIKRRRIALFKELENGTAES